MKLFCELSIGISVVLILLYYLRYKKTYNIYFSIIQFLVLVVLIARFRKLDVSSISEALIFDNIEALFYFYFYPLLLCGTFQSLNVKLSGKTIFGIFFSSTVIYGILSLSSNNGLFYRSLSIDYIEDCLVLTKVPSILFYVIAGFAFLYMILTFLIIIDNNSNKKIHFSLSLSVIYGYCLLILMVYLFNILAVGNFYISCFIEIVSQALAIYLADLYSNHDIETYSLTASENGFETGFVVFDSNKKLIAYSKNVKNYFPEIKELSVGSKISSVKGLAGLFLKWLNYFSAKTRHVTDVVRTENLAIRVYGSIKKIGHNKYYYFELSDYTAQEKLISIIGKDAKKLSENTKHNIDPKLFDQYVKDKDVSLDGQQMSAAVLFADIKDFTSISEKLDPNQMIKALNLHLSMAEKIIHKYDGVLDKYMGDSVMAFWIDSGDGSACKQAAKAADEIIKESNKLQDETYKLITKNLYFGIGINYGPAVLGNIGSDESKNYTLIGGSVNIASKVEKFAPKNSIYVSENTIKYLDDMELILTNDSLRIKGRENPLAIYRISNTIKSSDNNDTSSTTEVKVDRPTLYFCGVRGSHAVSGDKYSIYGGNTSCYVLKEGKHAIIIDCGTGFANAKSIISDCESVDVLITNLHYDHCIGLLNWDVFPKGVRPTFYGNLSKKNSLTDLFKEPYWSGNEFNGEIVGDIANKTIKLGNANVTFVNSFLQNEIRFIYIEIAGKKMLVLADSEKSNIDEKYLLELNYLLFDGMYDDGDYKDSTGQGHSTWQEGVKMAQRYDVGQLIITHHSVSSSDSVLSKREEEARQLFSKTVFAKDGDMIIL